MARTGLFPKGRLSAEPKLVTHLPGQVPHHPEPVLTFS